MAPLLVALALTQFETVIVRLPLDQPRYLYLTLPAAGLLVGITCARSAGLRLTTAVAGSLTIGLAGLWAYVATPNVARVVDDVGGLSGVRMLGPLSADVAPAEIGSRHERFA